VVSDVATRLLEMTDGTRTLQDCVSAIQSEFDAPAEVIERDVLQFVHELVNSGVVQMIEARP
jgi:hypothetical protein